jgi:hypothetical protein
MSDRNNVVERRLVEQGGQMAQPHDRQGFVGSWRMTFFEAEGPPTLALATFGADGTMVAAEHPVVTPPIAAGVIFTSAGHGAWQATGPDTAVFTCVGLGSYGQGILFGTATARSSITLGTDGQTFSGEVVWTVADREGNLLAIYPGTFQATRIVAEAPEMPTTGTPAAAPPPA